MRFIYDQRARWPAELPVQWPSKLSLSYKKNAWGSMNNLKPYEGVKKLMNVQILALGSNLPLWKIMLCNSLHFLLSALAPWAPSLPTMINSSLIGLPQIFLVHEDWHHFWVHKLFIGVRWVEHFPRWPGTPGNPSTPSIVNLRCVGCSLGVGAWGTR